MQTPVIFRAVKINKMKIKLISALLLAIFLLDIQIVQAQSLPSVQYNIIPYPSIVKAAAGTFIINNQTVLVITPGAGIFNNEQTFLKKLVGGYLGVTSLKLKRNAQSNAIILKYDAQIKGSEDYKLVVNSKYIMLSAKNQAGMFYAIQTLRQLMPADVEVANGKSLSVPAVAILDKPAFAWRGLMLDVSRHFFSIEYLEKYVDMMALYKLNKLHLHLTDDQGWRIEIKRYPRLAEESGWRTFNVNDTACMKIVRETGNTDFEIDKSHIIQKDGKSLYGGYYTQAQMRFFIQYAAKRHVEIIPEIDMPGHMMAAIKVYPYLTCDSTVGDGHGFSNPICPCKESVLDFADNIFSEIADLFPSKYIHIGGDEVNKSNWEKSPLCQVFMKSKGFTNYDQVQSYFNDHMMNFFKSKGKTLIGWDEIVQGGIDSSATMMFWRPWAPEMPAKATKNHNLVIMCPDGPLYFDAFPDERTLSSVYNYNPLDTAYHLNAAQQTRIIGVQGNLWTEMVPSEKRADYMSMPRMTALAELGWTHQPLYTSYLRRLSGQYERLDNLNVNYQLPILDSLIENQVFVGKTSYFTASPSPLFTIRYTVDGSLPVKTSLVMDKPININHNLSITMALFNRNGRRGDLYTINFASKRYLKADEAGRNLEAGLRCEFYKGFFNLTTKIQGIPDSVLKMDNVTVPKYITAPQFGLKYKGYIEVPQTGVYTFYLNCNDGGVLHIGGQTVVDNDGLHGDKEKGGQVALQKGVHTFALEFMEGGNGYNLDLKYSINNQQPLNIPDSELKFNP